MRPLQSILILCALLTGCATHGYIEAGLGYDTSSNVPTHGEYPAHFELTIDFTETCFEWVLFRHDSHIDAGTPVDDEWDSNVNSTRIQCKWRVW